MTPHEYYLAYIILVLSLFVVAMPLTWYVAARQARRETQVKERRICNEKMSRALVDQAKRIRQMSERARWIEDETYRRALAREETQVLERTK